MTPRHSRRAFLGKTATCLAALSAPTIIPASVFGKGKRPPPSERVTMALIGCGNLGMAELPYFLADERVQVVAVCDVNRETDGYWDNRIGGRVPARRLAEGHYAKLTGKSTSTIGIAAYEDYRELLAREDVDAVEIATPDHWHALQVADATRAGKHIYGQKPLALTIREGRIISDLVRRAGITWQTGSQLRSNPAVRRACELVRNGRLGKLQTIRTGLLYGTPDINGKGNRVAPEPVPAGLNYDLWLGPAPQAPYCPARLPVNWRWIFDYSGGGLTDIGAHLLDIAQWAMGTEETGPIEIKNIRGTFPPQGSLWNTALSYYFECTYENGVTLVAADSNQLRPGVTFVGSEGEIWCQKDQIEAKPGSILKAVIGDSETKLYQSDNHARNFIDGIYSSKPTAAPIETAHRTITIAHLANIALRLGRDRLLWDPKTEQIIGDNAAAKMLSRPMREPWKLPS